MNLNDAEELAKKLINEYAPGWGFKWDNAKTMIGRCHYDRSAISLSRPLTLRADVTTIDDIIRHELAHAKAGIGIGHGPKWRLWAYALGATPSACITDVEPLPGAWIGTCPLCGYQVERHRLMKKVKATGACVPCCTQQGRYVAAARLAWTRRVT